MFNCPSCSSSNIEVLICLGKWENGKYLQEKRIISNCFDCEKTRSRIMDEATKATLERDFPEIFPQEYGMGLFGQFDHSNGFDLGDTVEWMDGLNLGD